MKRKTIWFISSFLVLCFFWLAGPTCSAEVMDKQKIEQNLNRLEQIFKLQENSTIKLLGNSKITEADYIQQSLQLKALKLEIQSLQSDLLMTEERSKKLATLLEKAQDLSKKLEEKYEKTNQRHKTQKIVIGVVSVSAGAILYKLIDKNI